MSKLGVIGAGSWGTALAILLNSNGNTVTLWDRDSEMLVTIESEGVNKKYLPGVSIPPGIKTETNITRLSDDNEGLVISVPSHAVRSVMSELKHVNKDTIVISVAKGIENDTLLRVSQILQERFNATRIAVLSGPSHAEEVSKGMPTVVVCASKSLNTAKWIQSVFMSEVFRVYTHKDVIGVEIGGALKNIVAVAAGVIDGVGAGMNTKAALITRALAEITRLGTKLGADSLTFAGLSGMGDLIVTCMSKYSRNRYLGEQIGKGRKLNEILTEMVMVAEGVKTTRSAYELAAKHNVEVPIIAETYRVLFENKSPKQAVLDLMTRAAKYEDWG
ncbi:NAD(P)H-dependent glycerol-3-phosphate dehydrogenase [candidate division KSB1 bacterium]|nr:NAD(P)H-dependent glycerol-3-phosphate dehydrogenase [candidate division KSB1 bacterium]NIR68704.1 NAD(P)H-dependent glycerol-3-phosphate dehydrogenase [candidate division KSB1 bacterium]NIS25521.1 NAD(P)H-dependent glycerol-3-phosphate dehydrogenase [candidate division KSB1 bacterium]NIT72414.1 NAD(P)H-dependent glycerol-3-phosphate dehydrogenase [candidate division KSB1 bacterium]NIU26198.1 NAD(P)H-dependent glycerol-3-phosphate dehydrogenase [candidate division KSB1 bacterium]